jgi:anti-sigma-K factor RskA
MRYRDKFALQDRLAAEYVLGTLRGRARLRFEGWTRDDAGLRRRVEDWQARLNPLAEAVAPVRPPRRVWKAIEARIGAAAAAQDRNAGTIGPHARRAGFWESVSFWRTTGLVASGMAAALLVAIAVQKPQLVEVPVERIVKVPVERLVEVESKKMQPAYVAVLRDDAGKIVFLAYANRESNELWFRRIGMSNPGGGMGYELWALPTEPGAKPRSLGMIPGVEKGTIQLTAAADQALGSFPELAITMEPEKGSGGAATGPMIAKGDCQKFW